MLLNAVDGPSFEVSIRIKHPASVNNKVDGNWLKNWCSHEFIGVEFPRRFMINFIRSQVVMTEDSRFTLLVFIERLDSHNVTFWIIDLSDGFESVTWAAGFRWIYRDVSKDINSVTDSELKLKLKLIYAFKEMLGLYL